jgi:hypothetical protein
MTASPHAEISHSPRPHRHESVTARRTTLLLLILPALAIAFVVEEAIRTLIILERVERERDTWQRPEEVLAALDLRRESLAFLWIRAQLRGQRNIRVIVGEEDEPKLRGARIDAALVANTLHEMTAAAPVLTTLFQSMSEGGRLVVLDRAERGTEPTHAGGHAMTPQAADRLISAAGFRAVRRDDRFIDRAGDDDVWWLAVYVRSVPGSARRHAISDPGRTSSVGQANTDRSDHARSVAAVEDFGRVAEHLTLHSAVQVPRTEVGRASERHCHNARDADKSEQMVDEHRGRRVPTLSS